MHHVHDPFAGAPCHLMPVAVGRGDRRAARELHAERLGQAVHRRRRAHRVAIARRRGGRRDQIDHPGVIQLALRHHLARGPQDRARPGALPAEPAVEHRSDAERDGGNVDGGGRHQQRGRGLVAADGQHDAVDRIAVEHFDEAQIREVPVERRGRAFGGLLERMDREFERDAARLADAVAQVLRKLDMVPVARGEVRAGLRDADDRFARLQILAAQPVVHLAFQIDRRHVGIFGIVEPGARAQFGRGLVGHGLPLRCFPRGMRRPGALWQQVWPGALQSAVTDASSAFRSRPAARTANGTLAR